MADTTVKFIHSGMPNSPTLNGQVGALIGLLDAVLVNGFGLVNLTSLVISGGVATGTVAAGHSFEPGSVMLIAGATTTGGSVNGEQKAVATATNTFQFATTLADQAATGTITAKVAPLGWSNTPVAAGTNLKAYKSLDVAGTGGILRVDDTDTRDARVRGYLAMTDINTGTDPFPTTAQASGAGEYITKSFSADATAREWTIAGDSRGFYLSIQWSTGGGRQTYYFGDFISSKSPDPYACLIAASTSSLSGGSNGNTADVSYVNNATGGIPGSFVARNVTGLGTAGAIHRSAYVPTVTANYSGGAGMCVYPNPAANELLLDDRVMLFETSPSLGLRGRMPGLYYCPQSLGTTFAHRDILEGITGLSGKVLRALYNGNGTVFVDTTGPWR